MISTHKYSEQISLHEKCMAILELKIKAMKQLAHAEDFLAAFDGADRHATIRLVNDRWRLEERVEVYKVMVPSISIWYASYATKVCKAIVEVQEYDSKVQFTGKTHQGEGVQECDATDTESEQKTSETKSFLGKGLVEPINYQTIFHGANSEGPNHNIPGYC